ncbi:MAG: glycosyltransferase family 4 protein [Desulfurococcaceae archaeon]
MEAYIVHLFTVCGGGGRVSLEIASVLREKGFRVTYVTNSEDSMKKCAELLQLPGDYEVIEVKSMFERALALTGRFIRYRRLVLLTKAYEKLASMGVDGLTVDTDTNTAFNVDISYIHYPAVLSTVESNMLHWKLYNWLVARKARSMMGKPRLVLANSSWTAKLIKETYGLNAEVLHPPVDVDYYAYEGSRKERIIVTTSRITPEKNLHLLPRVASKLPNYEWYLVGSTGYSRIEKYLAKRIVNRIEHEKRKHNAWNFHVVMDLPRRELRELLQRATFYVHPLFPEHFGIAVVEAMSAGAVPIVYRDGGAWVDIVSDISRELGYMEPDEIPAIIRSLENNPGKLAELRSRAVRKSMLYRREVFREKFAGILEKLLSQK